jgi:hypothetical protein
VNDTNQLPGRLQRLLATERENAGPVNCTRSFGDVIRPESTPNPIVFAPLFSLTD